MDACPRRSRMAYRAVVYDHPRFVEYFRAATPEPELAPLNIGSRPARRPRRRRRRRVAARHPVAVRLDADAAAAAVLAGRGRALGDALARGEGDAAAHDVSRVAVLPLGARPDRDGAGQGRRPHRRASTTACWCPPICSRSATICAARLQRAVDARARASPATAELVGDNPVLRRSIDVRNPYVDPINLVQVELLRRLAQRQADETLERALLVTDERHRRRPAQHGLKPERVGPPTRPFPASLDNDSGVVPFPPRGVTIGVTLTSTQLEAAMSEALHLQERELADAMLEGIGRRPDQSFGEYYRGRRSSCALAPPTKASTGSLATPTASARSGSICCSIASTTRCAAARRARRSGCRSARSPST